MIENRLTARRLPALHLLLCMGLVWVIVGCAGNPPVRVGFIAELTGVQSEVGVYGRDGALLALETINDAGGIGGRPLELLVRDDLGTHEGAKAAAEELVDADVVAIVGHMISELALTADHVTEPAEMVLFSPTAASEVFTRNDDLFFRIASPLSLQTTVFAHYIFEQRGVTSIAIVYDADNAAFSEQYVEKFSASYTALSGQVVKAISIASSAQPDFAVLVDELRQAAPAGVLFVTSPVDTALLIQHIRLAEWRPELFSSSWAGTAALIQDGGQAVDGLIVAFVYNINNQSPAYLDFKARYETRFGRQPTFAAALAYETMMILAEALEKTSGQSDGLPQALREIQDFPVLGGNISLDDFGDVIRPIYLIQVQDGQFITLEAVNPGP